MPLLFFKDCPRPAPVYRRRRACRYSCRRHPKKHRFRSGAANSAALRRNRDDRRQLLVVLVLFRTRRLDFPSFHSHPSAASVPRRCGDIQTEVPSKSRRMMHALSVRPWFLTRCAGAGHTRLFPSGIRQVRCLLFRACIVWDCRPSGDRQLPHISPVRLQR